MEQWKRGQVSAQWALTHNQQTTNDPACPGRAICYISQVSPCVPQGNTNPLIQLEKPIGGAGKEHLIH